MVPPPRGVSGSQILSEEERPRTTSVELGLLWLLLLEEELLRLLLLLPEPVGVLTPLFEPVVLDEREEVIVVVVVVVVEELSGMMSVEPRMVRIHGSGDGGGDTASGNKKGRCIPF